MLKNIVAKQFFLVPIHTKTCFQENICHSSNNEQGSRRAKKSQEHKWETLYDREFIQFKSQNKGLLCVILPP